MKDPTYESTPLHGEADIIHATHILIEERISTLSTMVRKSLSHFHTQIKKYTTELTERIKRATTKVDYGFVRKPELRHQYGMLFNHHGQVISGLKNMDLFLKIDLPNVGRQGCRRKAKTHHPNDCMDHNDLNHNYTFGNPLHNIQKVCHYVSSLPRVCFPLYPFSTIL